jgi:hypothetical protein
MSNNAQAIEVEMRQILEQSRSGEHLGILPFNTFIHLVLILAAGFKLPLKSALAPGLRAGPAQNGHDSTSPSSSSTPAVKVESTIATAEIESPVPRPSPPRIHSDMHVDSTASTSSSAPAQPGPKSEDDVAPEETGTMDVDKVESADPQIQTAATAESDRPAAEQTELDPGGAAPQSTDDVGVDGEGIASPPTDEAAGVDGGEGTRTMVKEEEKVE